MTQNQRNVTLLAAAGTTAAVVGYLVTAPAYVDIQIGSPTGLQLAWEQKGPALNVIVEYKVDVLETAWHNYTNVYVNIPENVTGRIRCKAPTVGKYGFFRVGANNYVSSL